MPVHQSLLSHISRKLATFAGKLLYKSPLRAYYLKKFLFDWESYGMYRILRDEVGEQFNHRCVALQHGWTAMPGAVPTDLLMPRPVMLAWNTRYKQDWDRQSKRPCYVITAPFVSYRQRHHIQKREDAKGTLFYISHSTHAEDSQFDVRELCERIKALPSEFHPITLSIYTTDKHNEQHNAIYEEYGFDTVCLTDFKGVPYYEAFYQVISQFQYTASNEPGSYSFYSIEMGTPFFCVGAPANRPNIHGFCFGQSTPPPRITICDFEYGKKAYDLFAQQPYGVINDEQRAFVECELGIRDGISIDELREVLRKASR